MTEICDWDDLVQRDNLHYKKFTEVPFTGKTTGRFQGELKDGKMDGPWVIFWDNGQLRSKGTYKDGKMDGPWVGYNSDGTADEVVTGTYKDGKKDNPPEKPLPSKTEKQKKPETKSNSLKESKITNPNWNTLAKPLTYKDVKKDDPPESPPPSKTEEQTKFETKSDTLKESKITNPNWNTLAKPLTYKDVKKDDPPENPSPSKTEEQIKSETIKELHSMQGNSPAPKPLTSKNKYEHVTTISEFINSTAIEETIVTNCPKYREKFFKIVEKSGVGESYTKDKQAMNKIRSTRSWNWAAFLFNTHWAIYRKEKLLGWALFIIAWLIAVISMIYMSVPLLDKFGNFFPMFVAVFVGMYGNSFVLHNSIQTYEQTTSSKDREQRSPTGLAVAIVIDIASIGIISFLIFEEVI